MQHLDKQIHSISNGKPTNPLLAALSALLLALTVAACNNQQDQAPQEQQGQGPTGPLKTEPSTGAGMQVPGAGGNMANKPPSPAFQALDANGDGQISVKEAGASPKLAKVFKSLDDGDGQLDKREFSTFGQGKMKTSGNPGAKSPSNGAAENPNRPKNLPQ